MKTTALVYLAIQPMLATALVGFFVPSSYTEILLSMGISTLVFTILCLTPFFAYFTVFDSSDVRLVTGKKQLVAVVSTFVILDLLTYLAVGTESGIIISFAGSTAIYLSYFYYGVSRWGTIGRLGLGNSRKLLLALMVYLGVVPWTFLIIHGLSTTVSIYYASLLAFVFASAMSSTNSVLG